MSLQMALAAIAVLLLVLLFVRRRQSAPVKPAAQGRPVAAPTSTEFHAVSIKVDANACKAAKSLLGKRFLSGAAPRFPLPECDVLECNCRFVHHEDRRAGRDRRSPFRAGYTVATGKFEQEQRTGTDRRKHSDPFED